MQNTSLNANAKNFKSKTIMKFLNTIFFPARFVNNYEYGNKHEWMKIPFLAAK